MNKHDRWQVWKPFHIISSGHIAESQHCVHIVDELSRFRHCMFYDMIVWGRVTVFICGYYGCNDFVCLFVSCQLAHQSTHNEPSHSLLKNLYIFKSIYDPQCLWLTHSLSFGVWNWRAKAHSWHTLCKRTVSFGENLALTVNSVF